MKTPIIVVGTGVGGLTTALLSSEGHDILVLEKSSKLGLSCVILRLNLF